jgi:peptidoglycan hydrolase CwlO-like protein
VCKKKDKRICEKCNDQTNHSEPWKCVECRKTKSDKALFIDACVKYHTMRHGMEKAVDELKHDKDKIQRYEKEIERMTSEIHRMRTKVQASEEKLEQGKRDCEKYENETFVTFKKIKK